MKRGLLIVLCCCAIVVDVSSCEAMLYLDTSIMRYLGNMEACQDKFITDADGLTTSTIICENEKFAYSLPCDEIIPYSIIVISDSMAFSGLNLSACFESIRTASLVEAIFYGLTDDLLAQWKHRGWDKIWRLDVADSCTSLRL